MLADVARRRTAPDPEPPSRTSSCPGQCAGRPCFPEDGEGGVVMIAYATDEDVAIRAPADFAALCPKDQVLAAGTDGLFLPSDPWTLRSPSVDFAASGLMPGQVIRLAGPAAGGLMASLA